MDKMILILAEMLKIDPEKITKETNASDVENWDSLAQLMIVQKMEAEFSVTLEIKEILGIKNVGDIYRILEKRGIREF